MTELGIRLLWALPVNALLAWSAYRAGSVRPSGAWAGLVLGTIITVALDWPGLLVLGGFFILGSALTRMGYARKQALGTAEPRGGARGASHALANAGIPSGFALAALLTGDPAWGTAYVAAMATAAMDTAGSELGPLWGKKTLSLKTWRPVAPGTEGAVSLEGTLGGLAAAAVLGALGWVAGLPEQASHLVLILSGAFLGNFAEGLAGSRRLLPHGWLNAANTLVGGLVALAGVLWMR